MMLKSCFSLNYHPNTGRKTNIRNSPGTDIQFPLAPRGLNHYPALMQMYSPICFTSTLYSPILVVLALFTSLDFFLSQSDTHPVVSSIPHLVLFNPPLFTSLMFFPVLLILPASWGSITQLPVSPR